MSSRPVGRRSQTEAVRADERARQIIRTELETNLLVEAGAGSGKTQMLAERMAAGVASGAYRIEHMAAVTFTRKAASELRGRFHLALENQLAAGRGFSPAAASPAEQDRVRAALGNLERFFAGTIHSFCARLLRERPVESGVSPGFTELDEVQDEELRNRAWRDFIASTRAAGDPEMLALLDTGVRPQDLEPAFATICLHEDVEFPPGDAECPDPKPAWKALETFWKELQKHLPERIDPDTNCPIQIAARTFRGQLRVNRSRVDRPSVIASLLDTWRCKSEIKQFRWADTAAEKRRFRDLVNALHASFCEATVAPYLSQWRQYVYRLSVKVLMRAREHAARERHRRNSLNYGDLLNLTVKVLRGNPQVRRALQQKYRHLFVDEFQDTDPIQAEMVFLLAADEAAATGAADSTRAQGASRTPVSPRTSPVPFPDWRTVSLRPGALFVVGDPKQSIYRFRRADIEIYNIVRKRFEQPAAGKVVELTRNWRSVPALCEWANTVFEGPFPPEPTDHSPRFAPLVPRDDGDARSAGLAALERSHGGPLELWRRREPCEPNTSSRSAELQLRDNRSGLFTISHSGDSKEVAGADAAAIARYIRTEVDAGRRRFSDFLILTRKKKDRLEPYATALEALNVPIEVSGAGAFGKSPEVAALTVLLRALADHQDQLTLVNVLRGPLFGISDSDLFAFKQSGGWFSIFHETPSHPAVAQGFSPAPGADVARGFGPANGASIPATAAAPAGRGFSSAPSAFSPADDPVVAALATLRRCHRWTRTLPAAAALDRILEHTGYLALASTTPGGVEAGDLLHAVDRVRQVVENGGNLADAADALAADSEASTEVESLPLEPGRTDVVRLMNLHKAKGLEAKVVFLADPCGGFSPRVDVRIERRGAAAQGWFKVGRKYTRQDGSPGFTLLGEPADWTEHEQAEKPFLEHEQTRLFYVAATRAREMLVVSRFLGNGRSTPAWGLLNAALSTAPELPVPATANVSILEPAPCSATVQAEALAARADADARVNTPSWSITSVTAEARHIARMTARAEPAAADDATWVVAQDTPSHRADAGMAWGTLIHGLLEHAMRHKEATREDLRRLAMWLTVEEPQLRSVIEQAIDTVEIAAKAEFWAEAQCRSRSEEAPFAVAETARLTTGVIDLLYEGEAGWQVIDYKTDRSLEDSRYTAQLEAYRTALRSVGCRVAAASIVNVRMEQS